MTKPTTPLRQRMIEDMAIRNMSPLTQAAYVRAVANFAIHHGVSPDKLTFEDVRSYQVHLIGRGLNVATITPIMCALRFLYGTTLRLKDVSDQIPLPRKDDTLPTVLSRDQVIRLLQAVTDLRMPAIFITIYAAGVRVSEVVKLTAADINSQRMVLHIRQAKGLALCRKLLNVPVVARVQDDASGAEAEIDDPSPKGGFVAPTWVPWAGCATCIVLLGAELAFDTSL